MKAELYSFLLENKFKNGVMYIKSMHEFVVKYDMAESVEEESLFRRRMQRKSARNFDVGKGNESRGGNRKIGRYTMWK